MSSKNKRKYCEHCKEYLTLPVYKRHKAEYYDEEKDSWTTSQDPPVYDPSIDAEDDRIISISKFIDKVVEASSKPRSLQSFTT